MKSIFDKINMNGFQFEGHDPLRRVKHMNEVGEKKKN